MLSSCADEAPLLGVNLLGGSLSIPELAVVLRFFLSLAFVVDLSGSLAGGGRGLDGVGCMVRGAGLCPLLEYLLYALDICNQDMVLEGHRLQFLSQFH